jgi:hypothetical protein
VNDSELFGILQESIQNISGSAGQTLTTNQAVDLLLFFKSINLPVTQIDQVLVDVKQFGVTPSTLSDFINQISWCKLGSAGNFTMFLNTLVKLKVTMITLPNFIIDLRKFGFQPDNKNDLQSQKVEYLLFTLTILINYDITYEYQYDTRYTKISNCLYNLTLDGITLQLFGNKANNLAIELLRKLNRGVDLSNSTSVIDADKIQLNKNMRDLIIRRSNFFYNAEDTTPFGKTNSFVPTPTPETLSSFPDKSYTELFKRPEFMYEIDTMNPPNLEPLFNGDPIPVVGSRNSQETVLLEKKKTQKRILFYRHIVAQIPYEKNTIIPLPFDYCTVSNILTTTEYDQMLRTDGSVLVIRSVMSRFLNKLLLLQSDAKKLIDAQNTNAIVQYNSLVDTVNMISLFPHYSFYLIAKYIREYNPREKDPRRCGDPNYRAYMGSTIDPYIVELPISNTPQPNDYSYTENYEGRRNNYEDDPDETRHTKQITYDFYNRTTPFIETSSQYGTW